MTSLPVPWLLACIAIPLIGAAIVYRIRGTSLAAAWGVGFSAATVLAALAAWLAFLLSDNPVLTDRYDLLRGLGLSTEFAIDTLSAPLLVMAALLYLLTAFATLRTKIRRFSFAGMLLSEAMLLATLCCRSPLGIMFLLALSTVPVYWELRSRRKPTRIYVLHMALFVALLWVSGVLLTFSNGRFADWAAAPLLLAMMIRCGIAPFHCWLTDLFEHATFGTALLHTLPMVGVYAVVRVLLPVSSDEILRSMGVASLVMAVYAAGMSLVQTEARRFFCFIFLSHSALVLVGLASLSAVGTTGSLCLWLSLPLSLAGFGLTLRSLEARHGRLSLVGHRGVYEHTPALAICFLLTGVASVGFPGTFGFLGSEMLVDGAVQSSLVFGIAVILAATLNGIAVMQAYFKIFTGARFVSTVPLGITAREWVAVASIVALVITGGVIPQPGVTSRSAAARDVVAHRTRGGTKIAILKESTLPTALHTP